MPLNGSGWQPQKFVRFVKSFGSALRTCLVETDHGPGYLKGLGNPEGPHALACELVGTELADWLRLPTLDYAILTVQPNDDISIGENERVNPGPAFITRREEFALPWGGDDGTLANISDVSVISKLVVIDTWLRNCDRHAPDGLRRNLDNVLLIKELGSRRALRLVAMDFTHAFTCGNELTKRISQIDHVNDQRVYGLFPEFRPWIDRRVVRACAKRLEELSADETSRIVRSIPHQWEVPDPVRASLTSFILNRARFLAAHIEEIIWTQMTLNQEEGNGN